MLTADRTDRLPRQGKDIHPLPAKFLRVSASGVTEADYTLAPQPQPYGDLISRRRDYGSSFYHPAGVIQQSPGARPFPIDGPTTQTASHWVLVQIIDGGRRPDR